MAVSYSGLLAGIGEWDWLGYRVVRSPPAQTVGELYTHDVLRAHAPAVPDSTFAKQLMFVGLQLHAGHEALTPCSASGGA